MLVEEGAYWLIFLDTTRNGTVVVEQGGGCLAFREVCRECHDIRHTP